MVSVNPLENGKQDEHSRIRKAVRQTPLDEAISFVEVERLRF